MLTTRWAVEEMLFRTREAAERYCDVRYEREYETAGRVDYAAHIRLMFEASDDGRPDVATGYAALGEVS